MSSSFQYLPFELAEQKYFRILDFLASYAKQIQNKHTETGCGLFVPSIR